MHDRSENFYGDRNRFEVIVYILYETWQFPFSCEFFVELAILIHVKFIYKGNIRILMHEYMHAYYVR